MSFAAPDYLELKPTRELPRLLRVCVDDDRMHAIVSPRNRPAWLASAWADRLECHIGDLCGPVLVVGAAKFEITDAEAAKLIERFALKDKRRRAVSAPESSAAAGAPQ